MQSCVIEANLTVASKGTATKHEHPLKYGPSFYMYILCSNHVLSHEACGVWCGVEWCAVCGVVSMQRGDDAACSTHAVVCVPWCIGVWTRITLAEHPSTAVRECGVQGPRFLQPLDADFCFRASGHYVRSCGHRVSHPLLAWRTLCDGK